MDKKVLLVDDEVDMLHAFQKILRSDSVTIDTSETIENALFLLSHDDYDVVITDLRLNNTIREEGLEILRYAKELNPEIKVILITGYGSPDIMDKAYSYGTEFYFEKPVSGSTLKEALAALGVYDV